MEFIPEMKTAYDTAMDMVKNGASTQDTIYYLMNHYDCAFNRYLDAERTVMDAEEASLDLVREGKMCEGILNILNRGPREARDINEMLNYIEGFIEGSCYAYPRMHLTMERYIRQLRSIFKTVRTTVVEQTYLNQCVQYYYEEIEFNKRSAEIATEHLAKKDLSIPTPTGRPEEYVKDVRKIIGIQLYQNKITEFKYALAVANCSECEFMQYIDHSVFSLWDFINLNYPRKGFKKAFRVFVESMPRTKGTLKELQDVAQEEEGKKWIIDVLGKDYETTWIPKTSL